MNYFQRIFGAGPRGLLGSAALFIIAHYFEPLAGLPEIHGNFSLGLAIFVLSIIMTFALIVWSVKSLKLRQRGRELVTTGAYKYFRHPLYAAFLTFFNFGLSIFLDNYIYIMWAILQHPVWHINVVNEERMMNDIFPENYKEYSSKTGRFVPRFW